MVNDWLNLLCDFLPKVKQASVIRANAKGAMANWPEGATCKPQWLAQVKKHTSSDKITFHTSKNPANTAEEANTLILAPMATDGGVIYAVLCIEIEISYNQKNTVEALIQWALSWLKVFGKSNATNHAAESLERILRLLEQSHQQSNLKTSSAVLATALAQEYAFQRVLIVVNHNGQQVVEACSHHAMFDRRAETLQELEFCLNERDPNERGVMLASYKNTLAELNPPASITLIPLGNESEFYGDDLGCIVVYHDVDEPVKTQIKAQLNIIARHISPLYSQWVFHRNAVYWKVKQWLRSYIQKTGWVIWAPLAVILLLLIFVEAEHKIPADAKLEGRIRRAIVAPESGYLFNSEVKAGSVIQKGDLLAALDDKAIRLEINRWESEKKEYQRQFNKELNALNHVQMRIAKAKVAQAEAQLNLFRQKLDRVHIVAPMSGVITQGDLSRSIGSPVERGQVLFEMASVDEFTVVIYLPQEDIHLVSLDQKGSLVLQALPNTSLPFTVTAISSVYMEHKNTIAYRVEAELNERSTLLRPGMTGVVKISGQKRSLLWLATHRFVAWVQLKWWAL